MQNEPTRGRRIFSLLYPWVLLLPPGLYVFSSIMFNTPTNVLNQYGLIDFSVLIPILAVAFSIPLSVLGLDAARRWGTLFGWRRKATLILSWFLIIVTGALALLVVMGSIWILIRIAFFGFSV